MESKLNPVESYAMILEEFDKKLALGVSLAAHSRLARECKNPKHRHTDSSVVSICIDSGRAIECLDYSLSKINYRLHIIGDISLDIPKTNFISDIDNFVLKNIYFNEYSGEEGDSLSEIVDPGSWAMSADIIMALSMNPLLCTRFDSDVPMLALNKGWTVKSEIPLMYADNERGIINIIRGFKASGRFGLISMCTQ